MEATADPGPRIEALLADPSPAAAAALLAEAYERGGPLVDPLPGVTDRRGVPCSRVTFLYQAPGAGSVSIDTHLNTARPCEPMERVPATDLWWAVRRAADDVRVVYRYCADDPLLEWDFTATADESLQAAVEERFSRARGDPANPDRIRVDGPRWDAPPEHWLSVLTLSRTPPDPWHQPRPGVPSGSVVPHRIESRGLGNERGLSVYLPPGYRPDGGPYPLVVLLDGRELHRVVDAPTIVDNLLAEGSIPPPVLAMVENPDELSRLREYACNAAFGDFLAGELLPWLRSHYGGLAPEAKSVVVGGMSFGGLAGAHAGWAHPDAFGAVLSMSGSFWYAPDGEGELEWLTRQVAAGERLPMRWWLSVGTLERQVMEEAGVSMVASNRHLRTVLQVKGCEVHYSEYSGGHDFAGWRAALPTALVDLLAG